MGHQLLHILAVIEIFGMFTETLVSIMQWKLVFVHHNSQAKKNCYSVCLEKKIIFERVWSKVEHYF